MIAVTVAHATDVLMSAVSFPALSKRIACLRIPRIIFFIGKHFGTGLSLPFKTLCMHLIDDVPVRRHLIHSICTLAARLV